MPGAPVSMPIFWEEIDKVTPSSWDIKTAVQRARSVGDLFQEVLTAKQNIDSFLSEGALGKT